MQVKWWIYLGTNMMQRQVENFMNLVQSFCEINVKVKWMGWSNGLSAKVKE